MAGLSGSAGLATTVMHATRGLLDASGVGHHAAEEQPGAGGVADRQAGQDPDLPDGDRSAMEHEVADQADPVATGRA
jgi:hypothetical protein